MLYILGSFLSCGFIAFGWGGEGILHQFCLIIGGLYIGAILAEAFNYNETNKEEG
jgi:hypothetical protein